MVYNNLNFFVEDVMRLLICLICWCGVFLLFFLINDQII